MNETALIRRRRVVDAMGLGPMWIAREPVRVPADPLVTYGALDEPGLDEHTRDEPEARAAAIATMDVTALATAVTACRACALCESRLQAVPGAGATRPHWLVVGAAPAAEDDATGEAISGRAGRLLDAMLNAVGLSRRESVFVTTSVKCRPPDDRPPTALEIARCKPFLDRQIELLAPRLMVVLGSSIGDGLRGGLPSIAVPHPSELIERPEVKAEAWVALCRARELA